MVIVISFMKLPRTMLAPPSSGYTIKRTSAPVGALPWARSHKDKLDKRQPQQVSLPDDSSQQQPAPGRAEWLRMLHACDALPAGAGY
jgi:hypothetical protein